MKSMFHAVPVLFAVAVLLIPDKLAAQTPDFSLCDGLTGAAWGLCRGGVAVGCPTGSGNPSACSEIEQTFQKVTGGLPPWIEPPPPPVVCLCDFSVVPMTFPPWDDTSLEVFQCPEFPDSDVSSASRLVSLTDVGAKPETSVRVNINYDADGEPVVMNCSGISDKAILVDEILRARDSTPEEVLDTARACRADVIAYGQAFITQHPGVISDDSCTPILK